MHHRVRNIASEWKRLGVSEQALGWIRQGVHIPFIGTSMLDATQQQLDFMDSKLPRLSQSGAWEARQRSSWDYKTFLVPKPGEYKFRLIIDPRPLNKYCKEHKPTYKTLKYLKNPDAHR
jgi:hypothetical protein